ncbi:hypothetical protein TCAL_01983 [Tigriopus californicus]|uniref:BTB domain-containing protein n=1 Tax=Tigriopus californicus TaxID=6832 RepID=A0A553PPW2_TIGCA|nr:protein abrupt-like [Tigriopus californicus]XP_059085442.1 protein abrupt-like [Tigriopus californicus]TRY79720.1 hypothetical protein TCAL_01983 [Tigriopus californicus]
MMNNSHAREDYPMEASASPIPMGAHPHHASLHRSHSPMAVNPADSNSRPNSTPATPQSTSSTPHLPPSVSLVPPSSLGSSNGGREPPYSSLADSVPNSNHHPHALHHQSPLHAHHLHHTDIKSESDDTIEELLLKWDDHHRSFFEGAEDLCHNEHLVDVTLSCGEHSFPAHKLVLSVCSPYFRSLFLRNPCKHPIVVLKDVSYRYMKLLLMYMYRGEVSCPQEDLQGLLRTARSLQIRGLVELERRREAEGLTSVDGSPIKRAPSDIHDGASTTSCDVESREGNDFNIDDVRSRLHGQLEIQPISQPSSSSYSHGTREREGNGLGPAHSSSWLDSARHSDNLTSKIAAAASSSNEMVPADHGPGDLRIKDLDRLSYNGNGNNGTDLSTHHRRSPMNPPPRNRSRPNSTAAAAAAAASNAALLAAAQAAGMPSSALDPSDPMSSMNALLAAAQAHGTSGLPASTLASLLPSSSTNVSSPSSSSVAASSAPPVSVSTALSTGRSTGTNGQSNPTNSASGGASGGVDISQAAAVANLQLYYYMQKVASAGMGNPKERKECPICGKTLYDRSTWNRHMRIHTGEKPYPCRFCGRRFRTNYNKIGHEKKCPDRHARALLNQQQNTTNGPAQQENAIYR